MSFEGADRFLPFYVNAKIGTWYPSSLPTLYLNITKRFKSRHVFLQEVCNFPRYGVSWTHLFVTKVSKSSTETMNRMLNQRINESSMISFSFSNIMLLFFVLDRHILNTFWTFGLHKIMINHQGLWERISYRSLYYNFFFSNDCLLFLPHNVIPFWNAG